MSEVIHCTFQLGRSVCSYTHTPNYKSTKNLSYFQQSLRATLKLRTRCIQDGNIVQADLPMWAKKFPLSAMNSAIISLVKYLRLVLSMTSRASCSSDVSITPDI